MEEFMLKVEPVLLEYARRYWRGLHVEAEDLVQETMFYIMAKYEERIKDHPNPAGHCCRALNYIALNEFVREHKEGMFAGRAAHGKYDLYEKSCDEVIFLHDPWMDAFVEKRKRQHREYYLKNRDKYAKYYQEHKEEIKAYNRAYYQRNRKTIIQNNTEYGRKNIDARKALDKAYYQKHKDQIREKNQRYRQQHPEKMQEYKNRKNIYRQRYEMKRAAMVDEIYEKTGIRISKKKASKFIAARKQSEEAFQLMVQELGGRKGYETHRKTVKVCTISGVSDE